MYLLGLKDDYEHDGRVITQILSDPNSALSGSGVAALGACYKQLNSSVGQFANDTLQADTRAIESTSPGDILYHNTDKALASLEKVRDALALRIKAQLEAAAFEDQPIFAAGAEAFAARRSSTRPRSWRIAPDRTAPQRTPAPTRASGLGCRRGGR
jgi:hypothetical protein